MDAPASQKASPGIERSKCRKIIFVTDRGDRHSSGEPRRIRTFDPFIKSEMLYRLSYRLSPNRNAEPRELPKVMQSRNQDHTGGEKSSSKARLPAPKWGLKPSSFKTISSLLIAMMMSASLQYPKWESRKILPSNSS